MKSLKQGDAKMNNPTSLALRRVKAERTLQISNLESLNTNEIMGLEKINVEKLDLKDLKTINNLLHL
jgi:hypothetical protein